MRTATAAVSAAFLCALAAPTLVAQDHEADHQELRAMMATVKQAVNGNQLDGLIGLLDQDFSLTMLDQTLVTQPAQVKEYFARYFDAPGSVLKSVHIEPEADILTQFLDADAGVNRGTSTDTYTFKNGSQVVLKSRWTGTFRKVDGKWKISSLHIGVNPLENPILDFARGATKYWGGGGVVAGGLLGFLLGRRRK